MNQKRSKTLLAIATFGLLQVSITLAGGVVGIQWDNDASQVADSPALFYDNNQLTLLSSGVANTIGDGFLIQLIALQGGTNYLLQSSTVGDLPSAIAGSFNVGSPYSGAFDLQSTIDSNVLEGAAGSVLAIKFYDNTTMQNSGYYGIVSNLSITVPSPDWPTIQPSPTVFEPDYANNAYLGARTAVAQNGFYTDMVNPLYVVPEPSTLFLVGMGLAGALVIRQRKKA